MIITTTKENSKAQKSKPYDGLTKHEMYFANTNFIFLKFELNELKTQNCDNDMFSM